MSILDFAKNLFFNTCPIYEELKQVAFDVPDGKISNQQYHDILRVCKYRTRRVKSGHDKVMELAFLKQDVKDICGK